MHSASLAPVTALALALACSACRDTGSNAASSNANDTRRVVSLAPNLTEMIIAIGAGNQLAGRSSACDYPREALRHVPIVGGFGEPSIEALLSRQPTLIVDVALADQSLQHRLREAGLRREHIPCSQLDHIPDALRRLGELLERQKKAGELAHRIDENIDELRRRADETPEARMPLVFVEVWDEPLMTVGSKSYISECIRLAGGRNLGDEQSTEYYYISHERVIERDPDVILLLYMANDAVAQRVATRIGWNSVKAVRNRRIHSDLDPDLILRPGPRILEGISQLQRAIHPETRIGIAPGGEPAP